MLKIAKQSFFFFFYNLIGFFQNDVFDSCPILRFVSIYHYSKRVTLPYEA